VCTTLIVFSALPLIIAVSGFVPGALFSFSLYLTPELLVVLLGWFGWIRMRRPPEAPDPGQFPYPYPMPWSGPYSALPQQYSPAPNRLPPAPQPASSPWYGQGSPWQGQNPALPGQDSPWSDGQPGR